ncbi:MAG: alanine dehydrogenase [Spirochaetes bacterium RBG_16_49_21]|nr:MAG: alanine dehydrogenase [Spirochaetes bacterium RBG_16_49_21]
MIIGVPREVKSDENRVSITPAGVHEFVKSRHEVIIEKGAGLGSGILDAEYESEGARLKRSAGEIYKNAEMIIKVKEPQQQEIEMLHQGQILCTFLHLAPDKHLTAGLLDKGIIGIAYETIEVDGKLVCLEPMSEIAGKISSLMGAYYLSSAHGGKGILAGGVAGVHSANFLVLGGGTAGINAAKVAAGLGAKVAVMDIDLERMRYLEDVLPKNCETIMSNKINIEFEIARADVIIGTVLIPGAKTPKLVTREMLGVMKQGTVIVDVSIDQGGCAETSRPTTHSNPVYDVGGVIHYCVTNMPAAYPRSSTFALTNATLPFALEIAGSGWKKAALRSSAIAMGVNIAEGRVVYQHVAEAHALPYVPIEEVLRI